MSTNREKIAARMRALHAMTVENGCSEAEAELALSRLAEMQARYNLTLDGAEVMAEGTVMAHVPVSHEGVYSALYGINLAASVSSVVDEVNKIILFFGTKHDTEYAVYLLSIVHNAARTSFNAFIPTSTYAELRKVLSESHIRLSYIAGLVERLSNRIASLASQANEEVSKTGTEIIIIKNDKQKAAMNELGIETQAITKELAIDPTANKAGMDAADNVQLVKGLSSKFRNSDRRLN